MGLIVLIASEIYGLVVLYMAATRRRLPIGLGASVELGKNPVLFIVTVIMLVIAILFVTLALVVVVFRRLSGT